MLCLGYKGWLIKEYFLNYKAFNCDFTLQLGYDRAIEYHSRDNGRYSQPEDWRIVFAETGADTMTGARVKNVARYIEGDDFMLTYGDGLADVDINTLLDFHKSHGKIGTVTAVTTPARFGTLGLAADNVVSKFSEKPSGGSFVSGGFFVFKRAFLEYLSDAPECVMEREPLERLAADGQLVAYSHQGFWQAMDTYREFEYLNKLWSDGFSPWRPRT